MTTDARRHSSPNDTTTAPPRTRIAPTPSGYLHEGNLVNALLTVRLAREVGAEVALRIDDMDAFRLRREYVEDIFRCLDWLGLSWQTGPRDMRDYDDGPTPEERSDHYYARLRTMVQAGLPAFVCRCSRRELGRDARCERGCRDKPLELLAGKNAIRLHLPASEPALIEAFGDPVLWRREDLPAYQLASLVDDHDMAITHIVRGVDLHPSTDLQRWMAHFLPDSPFLRADIRHHALVTGPAGEKLSKSQGTARLELTPALREQLDELVASISLPGPDAA